MFHGRRIFPGNYDNAFESICITLKRTLDVLGMKQKFMMVHVFSETFVHVNYLKFSNRRGNVTIMTMRCPPVSNVCRTFVLVLL